MRNQIERVNKLIVDKAIVAGITPETSAVTVIVPDSFDATCLLIRNENLAALRGIALSDQRIDFCYIDPPYNTGNRFLYEDNRRCKSTGIWGSHQPWMEFMLPRLVYAREILADTGIIAISIDDYAYPQLKVLMDLVFGEELCLGTLVVIRSKNGLGSNQNVADMHEYVTLYGRSSMAQLRGTAESEERIYEKADIYGSFTLDGLFRKKGEASRKEDRPNMFYPLYVTPTGEVYTERKQADMKEVFPRDSKGIDRRWLWGKEKATQESWRLFASSSGVVYVKSYEAKDKRVRLRSLLSKPQYLTDTATREIKEIYGEKVFDTPKPLKLITDLIDCCCSNTGLVLDFFAGSGTTGEAVAALNSANQCSRKVILVEHEADIPTKHVAHDQALHTTADITMARLKHVSQKYSGFTYATVH